MYIGLIGECGLYYFIWEVVDNVVDEVMVGYVIIVNVVLFEDGGVEVVDDGCGILVVIYVFGILIVDVVMI